MTSWSFRAAAFGAVAILGGCATAQPELSAEQGLAPGSRPNILLLVADDLGYSDLGLFGSEIRTPNIDALAADGLILNRFYTSVACQPTRAMLMSGTDNHLAGVGRQGGYAPDELGYEGYLTRRVASVAERLSTLDYHTAMVGKWHLGERDGQTPADRGFQDSFVLLQPGAFHFDLIGYGSRDGVTYRDNGRPVESLPEDFYSTVSYTDHLIEFIDNAKAEGRPFFGYAAYTSPHWPIQALDEDMAKTRGMYDEGYDVIRERRFERFKELGYAPADARPPALIPGTRPWTDLTPLEQAEHARTMEAFAAMVERLDAEVGRIVAHLEAIGERDNTLIMFISDNGAEGTSQDGPFIGDYRATWNNSLENIGRRDSYRLIGTGWGEAGSAPLYLAKSSLAEGGIRAPAIVNAPALGLESGMSDELVAVFDLAPTFVELAGGDNGPFSLEGESVLPMTGRSFAGLMRGDAGAGRGDAELLTFEHGGHRAVLKGEWKALWLPRPIGTAGWQLFNIAEDPGETTDLAAENPQLLAELTAAWDDYAANNMVRVVE